MKFQRFELLSDVGITPPPGEFRFREVPCWCGFTPEKQPEQFEDYWMEIGSVDGVQLPKKRVLRCATCKEISIVSREG